MSAERNDAARSLDTAWGGGTFGSRGGDSGQAFGRSLRTSVPRGAHANLPLPDPRPDPISLLESANEGRVP
jgi:hypothetical protein